MDRRKFIQKGSQIVLGSLAVPAFASSCKGTNSRAAENIHALASGSEDLPDVYFTKEITPDALMRIYQSLGRKAEGQNVAVKVTTGEPGGNNFLKPDFMRDFVQSIHGTIIECNTAYGGGRDKTEEHLQAARNHGFMEIADVDIMDADGEVELPVRNGTWLKKDIVGKNWLDYDFTVILSHFKGHAMGGFGGAIKNMAIGIASSHGKAWIHSAGKTTNQAEVWGDLPPQDHFLEAMAEAASAITDHAGDKILHINVMNKLSVDCDCDGSPEDPQMGDIGILASLDPVALDKACVDLVYASPDPGKVHLIERMESRNGIHTLDHAEKLCMGSQKYNLVDIG